MAMMICLKKQVIKYYVVNLSEFNISEVELNLAYNIFAHPRGLTLTSLTHINKFKFALFTLP